MSPKLKNKQASLAAKTTQMIVQTCIAAGRTGFPGAVADFFGAGHRPAGISEVAGLQGVAHSFGGQPATTVVRVYSV